MVENVRSAGQISWYFISNFSTDVQQMETPIVFGDASVPVLPILLSK